MKASRTKPCSYCNRLFLYTRSDSKWCSHRCRGRARQEDAKFRVPNMPKSGHPGITFNRRTGSWIVNYQSKYVGSFRKLSAAITFSKEIRKT